MNITYGSAKFHLVYLIDGLSSSELMCLKNLVMLSGSKISYDKELWPLIEIVFYTAFMFP